MRYVSTVPAQEKDIGVWLLDFVSFWFLFCSPSYFELNCVAKAGLDLIFLPLLLSFGTTGMHHHTWVVPEHMDFEVWEYHLCQALSALDSVAWQCHSPPGAVPTIPAYQLTWAGSQGVQKEHSQRAKLAASCFGPFQSQSAFSLPPAHKWRQPLFLWPWASYYPESQSVFCQQMEKLIGLTSSGHCETLCERAYV